MKLINISKQGTLKFQLKDGRHVLSYNSGYVRMDNGKSDRIYQMNKVRKIEFPNSTFYTYERILIHCPQERYNFLLNFEKKNCTTK
tara:strand:+ start:450 stop:707 length:258 start_codon:yes stop_codon:yes gene_type:complete